MAQELSVHIGGQKRTMCFDFNAYSALEEQHNQHFMELYEAISGSVRLGKLPRASDISKLVWAGLYAVDESVTLRQVRSWIDLNNMNDIVASLFGGAPRDPNSLAPFVPTPDDIVSAAIASVELQPGDTFIDLGAGDGRTIAEALAKQPDLKVIGIENDDGRYAALVERFKGDGRVALHKMLIQDYLKSAESMTAKVFVYLLTTSNEVIRPELERILQSGSRVVSHDFQFPAWPLLSSQVITIEHTPHAIYTYSR